MVFYQNLCLWFCCNLKQFCSLICKLFVTEKRTYVSRGAKLWSLLTVWLSMPFDKLPCSQTRILNERYAIFAIVIGLLLPYMNIGINLFLNEFHGKLMKSCLDLPRDHTGLICSESIQITTLTACITLKTQPLWL